MKKALMLWCMVSCSCCLHAQEVYENNLFDVSEPNYSFASESDLVQYLKTNKVSTYLYYERLSYAAQQRVFKHHKENTNRDITEIVIFEYRNRN